MPKVCTADGIGRREILREADELPPCTIKFSARSTAYRELPVRLAEYGTCYRYEKSASVWFDARAIDADE